MTQILKRIYQTPSCELINVAYDVLTQSANDVLIYDLDWGTFGEGFSE